MPCRAQQTMKEQVSGASINNINLFGTSPYGGSTVLKVIGGFDTSQVGQKIGGGWVRN